MRFSIGLTRLPLPQFTWASIDRQVETRPLVPAETTPEESTQEAGNE
jgi:hypothetical protein